ncbi:MAG: hypothetical protein ACI4EG_04460 [Fusicatenibacter sp.]
MKKVLIKTGVLFLIFAVSVVIFTCMMSRETAENTTDMESATMPVMYMKVSDTLVNRMYGYQTEMESATLRETLTPLPMDRTLTLAVDAKGCKVKNVTYTVESADGSGIVENSVIKSFREEGAYLTAEFSLETPILMNQEYTLKLQLNYGDGSSAWYYTRIVQRASVDVSDYLEFVTMFYENCLNKEQAEVLSSYIEPNSSGNNSSFLEVDIHSSLDQISWGSLAPSIVLRAVPLIKEINETTTSIAQEYVISASDGEGGTEYYSVTEFYRMRKSSDRVVLLDFERSAVQIFDADLDVLTNSGINLGVTGKDTRYVTNTAADIAAFVVNGDLWCYNRSANKCVRIFSFRDGSPEGIDERDEHREHDINVVRVDDTGDVTFVVYGYMNRGNHEGEVGAAVYYYSAEKNVATEEIFVPSDSSFAVLHKNFSKLSYVSTEKKMYLYLNEALYRIDTLTGEYEILWDNIPEECFVVSESQSSVAWMEAEDNSSSDNVTVMSLESEQKLYLTVSTGQKIRALGFINEDFVYGVAYDSDIVRDISGNETFAMHTLWIEGLDGTVKKEYHQEGYFISDVTISDGLLELQRVVRGENGFVETTEDHIMNGEQQSQETVTSRMATMDDRKGQQFLLEFASGGKTKSLLSLIPKYVYSAKSTELIISYNESQSENYYVYAKGKLLDIVSSPARAIQMADENVGVVLNSEQSYVWERGNRQTAVRLDEQSMPEAFRNASLDESVLEASLGESYTLLNLTGCTLDQVLYLVSSGSGVVVKISGTESRLMTGYDQFGNTWLYNPETDETTAMGPNDSETLFAENGNVFISYRKNGNK